LDRNAVCKGQNDREKLGKMKNPSHTVRRPRDTVPTNLVIAIGHAMGGNWSCCQQKSEKYNHSAVDLVAA
jgi:hypothetical protein